MVEYKRYRDKARLLYSFIKETDSNMSEKKTEAAIAKGSGNNGSNKKKIALICGIIAAIVVIAAVVLIVIFIAIRFFSVKLPLKPFFLATSILMAVMAISFLGAGIKELMEGSFELVLKIQGVTPLIETIPVNDFLDVFGIYPHTETIVPQVILLCITVYLFIRQHFENKRIKEELKTKAELKELKS